MTIAEANARLVRLTRTAMRSNALRWQALRLDPNPLERQLARSALFDAIRLRNMADHWTKVPASDRSRPVPKFNH